MGFGSLFMDASSELIHSLLPLLMVGTLGASMTTVGWVEGVAEATAAVTKGAAGAIRDYAGRRTFRRGVGSGRPSIHPGRGQLSEGTGGNRDRRRDHRAA